MKSSFPGRLLRGIRAGDSRLAWQEPAFNPVDNSLTLSSPAFIHQGTMPLVHAGKGVGGNLSPTLQWSPPPSETASLVLIMEDPDVPLPRPFVHLIAYNLAPALLGIAEGELNGTDFSYGRNTLGSHGYQGPRALPGHGPHRYIFQLYALDRTLNFAQPPRLRELLGGMRGAVLARGRLDGIFEQY